MESNDYALPHAKEEPGALSAAANGLTRGPERIESPQGPPLRRFSRTRFICRGGATPRPSVLSAADKRYSLGGAVDRSLMA